MDLDEFSTRPAPNLLTDLARQDLDPLSVEELDERVVALEAEIARTQAHRKKVVDHRASADALFRKR